METPSLVDVCEGTHKYRLAEVQELLLTMMSQHEDLTAQWENPDYGVIPLLVGRAGIGKSQSVHQVATIAKVKLWRYYPGALVLEDNLGLPYREEGKVKYARPPWLPDGPGILFIDELATADNSGQQTQIKELISERKVGGIELPSGVFIVGATNPDRAEYSSTNTLDLAVRSRCLMIPVRFDPNDTLDYWQLNDLLPSELQGFFRMHTQLMEGGDPRRILGVADVYARHRHEGKMNKTTMRELIGVWLGNEIGFAFAKYMDLGDNPLAYPILARDYLLPGKTTEMHTQHLFCLKEWADESETALIGASTHELIRAITEPGVELDDYQCEWVAEFLEASQALDACANVMVALRIEPHFERIYQCLKDKSIAGKLQDLFVKHWNNEYAVDQKELKQEPT